MTNRILVAALALVAFLGNLTQLAIAPMLATLSNDFGTSTALVGQAVTITFMAGATLGLIVGPMSDHYGHRRLLIIGGLLAAFSTFASAAAPDYWTFLLSRIPGGLGGGMLSALAVVIASNNLPESERRIGIGWILSSVSATPIIGIPLMTELGDRVHWRASMILLGALLLVSLQLIVLLVPGDRVTREQPFRPIDTLRAYVPFIKDPASLLLQLSNFLRTTAGFILFTYVGAYLMNVHDVGLRNVGYVFIIGGIGHLIGTRLGDGRHFSISLRSFCTVTSILMAATFSAPFIFTLGPITTSVFFVLGCFTLATGYVALIILITEESPGGQSTAMMMRQSGWGYGNAAAGAVGGILLATGGFAAVGMATLVLGLLAAVAVQWVPGQARQEPDPAPVALD